jgi:hypothetical protein
MHHFSIRRVISFLLLLALNFTLAHSALAQAAKGNFCIADPRPRAAAALPDRQPDCPAGFVNQGASCKREADTRAAPSTAPECPAGYKLNGASCERPATTKPNTSSRAADCPDGYSNSGTACFRLSGDPLPASRMTCSAGETKIDSRCYKACPAGLTSSGANCVSPTSTLGADKMSCKAGFQKDPKKPRCLAQCAAGYNNTGEACVRPAEVLGAESMSCKAGEKNQNGRCVAAVASCKAGETLQGDTCYAACAPGYEGIGGSCWPQAPKAWVACGIGAAKDTQSCAAATLDGVAKVRHLAVGLVRDGNVVATPAKKVDRLVALLDKYLDLGAAYNGVKDTPQFKRDLAAWNQDNQGREAFVAPDTSGAPITEPVMMRHAMQLGAIAGYAGGASTASYPKCSTIR